MSKISLIVLSIALGLVIFIVGGGMGIVYQSQMETGNTAAIEKCTAKEIIVDVTEKDCVSLVKALSSSVVTSVAAHGTVINIEGNNITLKTNKDSVIFSFAKNVQISSFSFPSSSEETGKTISPTNTAEQKKSIGDIKIGDVLNIDVNILSTGSLEIKTATIINSK